MVRGDEEFIVGVGKGYIYIYNWISRAGINVVFSWLWNRNTNGYLIGMVGLGLKKFT